MKKNFSTSITVFIFLCSIIITSLPAITHAASVSITESKVLSPHLLFQDKPKKITQKKVLQKKPATSLNHSDFIAPPPIKTSPQHRKTKTLQNTPYDEFKKIGKKLLNENADNELVRESAKSLISANQFINETETFINNLTKGFLKQKNGPIPFKKTVTPPSPEPVSPLSLQNITKLTTNSNTPFRTSFTNQHQKGSINLSDYKQNATPTIPFYYDEFNESILKKLFKISNLLYLFLAIIVFSTIKKLVVFLLFRKYDIKH